MTDPRLIVAIDPGLSGALAVLSPGGELERVDDLPVIRDGKLSWIDGGELQGLLIDALHGRPARVFVERVGAMPRQGVSSSFHFGMSFGSLLAIVQARRLPIELVMPGVWKAAMGLGGKAKNATTAKHASLNKARLLFPSADLSLCKHEGRAEACLLGYWALNRRNTAFLSENGGGAAQDSQ